jgi:hypothetical protein
VTCKGTDCGQGLSDSGATTLRGKPRKTPPKRGQLSHTFEQRTLLPILEMKDEYLRCARVGRESADWRVLIMRHLVGTPLAKAQSNHPIDNPMGCLDPEET